MSTPAQTPCALCALAVGNHPFTHHFAEAEKQFCCLGCLNVYTILHESGALAGAQDIRETDLFKRSLALGLISNGDQAAAQQIPPDAPRQEMLLQVSGMWCSSCAWLIEHALHQERGVVSAEAFFASDLVKINYCPQYAPPERLTRRLAELGYRASEYTGEQETAQAERRDLLLRLGVAGFFWLNLMTLSTPLYVSLFEPIGASFQRGLPLVLMALATPVIFYSAQPIMRLAWGALREGTVRMETLLGLGILAAFVYSAFEALRGATHVYFDTASAIVTLVLLGKLIERSAKERTGRALTLLYRLMPKKVRRLTADGAERFVALEALTLDDVFMVKAGERIPADGVIVTGATHVDESLLTGEAAPIAKATGDTVVAGSLNTGGVIEVRATRIGGDTTLAQIIRAVEHALSSRSGLERTVDRIARVFVPIVMVIAVATCLGWWSAGAPLGEAILRAITVLVIACPCALGMATPLALTAALGAASRQGILVRDSRVLETVRKVDTVVFDKTGTVTEGEFALVDETWCLGTAAHSFSTASGGAFGAFDARVTETTLATAGAADLAVLAALERYSEHPLGRAVVRAAEQRGLMLPQANEVEIHKGAGLTGSVYGRRVFVGNRRLAESETFSFNEPAAVPDWQRDGHTIAYFGWDGAVRGALAFGDRLKADAAATVQALRQRGIRVLLVSGDARAATERVAHAIGVDDFVAAALPADKIAVIERLQQDGQVVAMVGDGVNDAPALAQADLGIAISSGADIAMHSAAVVLLSRALSRVPAVFDLANRTWRVVRQNLFWAFLYNTLGISLAVANVLNPLLAATAMLLSSLSVIGNSLRLNHRTTQTRAN